MMRIGISYGAKYICHDSNLQKQLLAFTKPRYLILKNVRFGWSAATGNWKILSRPITMPASRDKNSGCAMHTRLIHLTNTQ